MSWKWRAAVACALFLLAGVFLGIQLTEDRRAEERQHERLIKLRELALTPFVSDGCSGGLSSVWNTLPEALAGALPFEACCIAHDRSYHFGGEEQTARAGYDARLAADRTLQTCVAENGGQVVADAMFHAVRLGGGPCSGLSWRWGYGRADCP